MDKLTDNNLHRTKVYDSDGFSSDSTVVSAGLINEEELLRSPAHSENSRKGVPHDILVKPVFKFSPSRSNSTAGLDSKTVAVKDSSSKRTTLTGTGSKPKLPATGLVSKVTEERGASSASASTSTAALVTGALKKKMEVKSTRRIGDCNIVLG